MARSILSLLLATAVIVASVGAGGWIGHCSSSWLWGPWESTVMCAPCAQDMSMAVEWRACMGFDLVMSFLPLELLQSRRRGSSWRTAPPRHPPQRRQLPPAMDRLWLRLPLRPRHLAVSGSMLMLFGFRHGWAA